MSIINPEELRLPAPKVPDSMKDGASRAAFTALAALVDTCCTTTASERPTMECVALQPSAGLNPQYQHLPGSRASCFQSSEGLMLWKCRM
jgi:hypothetical protein